MPSGDCKCTPNVISQQTSVTQYDYLVPVSNALYSLYLLWDVVLMFMCVSGLSEPTNIIWNQGPVLAPHAALVAGVIECLDGGWRL